MTPSTRASGSSSHLQVSVEPAQSSFFAGEEFVCTITFTNTREPVPLSAPLPSRPRFGDGELGASADLQRRIASTSLAGDDQSEGLSPADTLSHAHWQSRDHGSLHSPMHSMSSPTSTAPFGRGAGHRKSQSVDIRTYARRNQLDRGALDDEAVSDEKYYRVLSEAAENQGDALDEGEQERLFTLHARELLENLPSRRRLIGKEIAHGCTAGQPSAAKTDNVQMQSTPPSSRRHNKAFSVATPGYDEGYMQHPKQSTLGIGHPAAGAFSSPRMPSHRFPIDAIKGSPDTSRDASTSFRKPSGPIAKSHPHSRKKSVAQVQAEDLSATFELDGDMSSHMTNGSTSPTSPTTTLTPRGSTEARHRGPENGFYGLGENSTMESVLREDITQYSRAQHAQPIPSIQATDVDNGMQRSPLFAAKSSSQPGTETVLWAFAQFGGHFVLDESLVKPGEFEQVKQKLAGSSSVLGGGLGSRDSLPVIGGGELGDAAEHEERETSYGSSRKSSWGSYLRGVLSPGGAGAKRASLSAAQHRRSGSTLLDTREKTLASRTVPILSNPPSMVAVDLQLAPGESKSYTFRTPLAPDLPPSYMGRAISFAYSLTLGTNRLVKTKRGSVEQKSRLARIPMRLYNHINVSGVTTFFDLTNPIINHKDEAIVQEQSNEDVTDRSTLPTNRPAVQLMHSSKSMSSAKSNTLRVGAAAERDLLQYTQSLLGTCRQRASACDDEIEEDDLPTDVELATKLAQTQRLYEVTHTSPTSLHKHRTVSPTDAYYFNGLPQQGRHRHQMDHTQAGLGLPDEDDLPKSSLQAVELLSRNSQKVSYDISKDGEVAAVLTLIKSKYRLGDTVTGVVTINKAQSIARVVRLSATLETHEEIEGTLSTLPAGRAQRLTRTVHSTHHDSTLDTGLVCFSLPIPSGATPNFNTSAVRLAWTVRLAFLTLSSVRDPANAGTSTGATRARPPPHLIAGSDDGYAAYHRALRAAPTLAGPWTGAADSNSIDEGTVLRGAAAASYADIPASGEAKLEVVECAVPLMVLPHSTRFTVGEVAYSA